MVGKREQLEIVEKPHTPEFVLAPVRPDRANLIAFGIVILLVLGVPAALYSYQLYRIEEMAENNTHWVMVSQQTNGGFRCDTCENSSLIEITSDSEWKLVFTSQDVVHSFAVMLPSGKLEVLLYPGYIEELVIPFGTPAGDYEFFCGIMCGEGHEDMLGILRVT